MRIVRATREEFETEEGDIFPITPSLKENLTIEEFQKHYDFATKIINRRRDVGGHTPNTEELGQRRED